MPLAAHPCRRWFGAVLLSLILTALTVGAATQPLQAQTRGAEDGGAGVATAQRLAEREQLFDMLSASRTPAEGRAIEDMIWRFWMRAPGADAQALLDSAIGRLRVSDLDRAEAELNRLIALAPGYAEAYNQRAILHFIREEFDASLDDIERTLAIEPKHFGALSGRAQIFLRQGRSALALQAIRDAVAIHPWLRERALLPRDEPGAAPGTQDL